MRIQFWGTRGSIAKPGPSTLQYGGNTPCVEVVSDDGTRVILDCGTGFHGLGQALIRSGEKPLKGHLLITHFHWDHIQGFPFFVPLFVPGNEWDIYGPGGMGEHLEHILAGQMTYSYFPITLDEFGATIRFTDLGEGAIDVGGIRVTAKYTNHPALTFGFRLDAGGASVVYVPDHEPYSIYPTDPAPNGLPAHREDRKHIAFMEGADLLIHDGQYTLEEYPSKVSWGHSPFEKTVDYAIAARAERLAIFHHDPLRDDEALTRLVEDARRRAGGADHDLEVFAAAEGMAIELPERKSAKLPPIGEGESAALARQPQHRDHSVLIVDDDPHIVKLLERTLAGEKGLRSLSAGDGDAAIKAAIQSRPSLILLDIGLPRRDGLEVCRTLRAHADPKVRDIPIVIVTGRLLDEEDIIECFEAGASDYLTKQFTPTQLRSRVRGWLLRTYEN